MDCQVHSLSVQPALWAGGLTKLGIAISMDGKGRWMDNVFVERLWRNVKDEDAPSAVAKPETSERKSFENSSRQPARRKSKSPYSLDTPNLSRPR